MADAPDPDATATAADTATAASTIGGRASSSAMALAHEGGAGVPGYTVTGEIGRGGMGRVVRATEARLAREVAI